MDNNRAINDWLLQKQIKVPMEWLGECINWLRSENPCQTSNLERLKSQVYEQWLMTDLCELGHATLPTQIKSEKYILNGRYCLQINSITDTSQSYYSQLLDLREENEENTNVTAETQSTQFTQKIENNSSRMLMMELTDGCIQLYGMEYQHINSLNTKITPGTKIRVKGPIMCRKGVLMLKDVEILGGEADNVSCNTPQVMICKALNLPVPTTTSETDQNNLSQDPFEEELPSELLSQLVDESGFDSNPTTNQPCMRNHHQQTNASFMPMTSSTHEFATQQRSVTQQTSTTEDDFDDDVDIDDIITSHDFLPHESTIDLTVTTELGRERKSLSYLCDIKRNNIAGCFIIKGFIITLLSKLSSTSDDGWKLSGRICDGSDYLDVQFSNHFLTNLIGYTSNQANEIKLGVNSKQVEDLKEGMMKCRKYIIETCRIMEVDYNEESSSILDVITPQIHHFPYFSSS